MTHRNNRILPAVARAALAAALALLAACSAPRPDYFQGYAEGEYVYVAAPAAGRLVTLAARRGMQVRGGDPLFALDDASQRAAVNEAAARLQRAQAQLANLEKGRRPQELAVIRAQQAQAEAALRLSRSLLQRRRKLYASKAISPMALDEARAAYRRDRARVAQLAAEAKVARLGARSDEIKAARDQAQAAHEALAQAQWRLDQTRQRAHQNGLVSDTFYVPGEWVPAGRPVVALLPPQNVKVRFFVPETELGAVRVGETVALRCDGCRSGLRGRISYISPQAEYTPPVIYSERERRKLVFLVEARPAPAVAYALHPGQPVDVRLIPR
ncbi:MAG: HlyD family efflux transporter periplasmic adaptor subunit [Gammaproteobacteria bacterium]|nr:HlyD family efflux transporter periplasmic adaptor subunit [Gammaproteobacteria bacterium]